MNNWKSEGTHTNFGADEFLGSGRVPWETSPLPTLLLQISDFPMIIRANRVYLPSNKARCFSPAETPKAEEPMENTLNPVLLEDS